MEIVTILISISALIISIASYKWNKAKHNLNQLQENGKKLCESLQEFIDIGTEYYLATYKYELENICLITNEEKRNTEFNNLQIKFSQRDNKCKQKYKLLIESLNFFEFDEAHENKDLVKWLNKTLNEYFGKLNLFYKSLYDINEIVLMAKRGVLYPEKKEYVRGFFANIRDLLDYNEVISFLKMNIAGYFAKLSLADVGLFGMTTKALTNIENNLMKYINDLGLDDAILKKDYVKIRKQCLDYGEGFDEFVKEEEREFFIFLTKIKDIKKK